MFRHTWIALCVCLGVRACSALAERLPPFDPPLHLKTDFTMREELVLKTAILAEKYAPDVQVGCMCVWGVTGGF